MKIGRDAFLYMAPEAPKTRFAQCSTCRDWVHGDNRCAIHGPSVLVRASLSCGLYVHGPRLPPGTKTHAYVTPEESGLVDREVRCENCRYFDEKGSECGFYDKLNVELPDDFDLDVKVDAHGCCNANMPEE